MAHRAAKGTRWIRATAADPWMVHIAVGIAPRTVADGRNALAIPNAADGPMARPWRTSSTMASRVAGANQPAGAARAGMRGGPKGRLGGTGVMMFGTRSGRLKEIAIGASPRMAVQAESAGVTEARDIAVPMRAGRWSTPEPQCPSRC